MSQQLINLNTDLKQLRDEGYQIEIYGGHLIVHHIPFVDENLNTKLGVLICELTLSGNITLKPTNHVMMFSGDQPCDEKGMVITGIAHRTLNQVLRDGLVINRSFSNKPKGGFMNYYEKVKRYAEIISAPAIHLDETLTSKPFIPIENSEFESVFEYYDTNSSRANIDFINEKLIDQKIAIVGLGGTGSYILDLITKCCVSEIHLYDGDVFLNHNAFRSPGAASLKDLKKGLNKTEYFANKYSVLHRKIAPHNYNVSAINISELKQIDFVFLCIDDNVARSECIDYLLSNGISFIDVGLGVNIVNEKLIGTIRVTTGVDSKNNHLAYRIPAVDNSDNIYSTNIQIAELNSLNASLAVIKWKKLYGFYQDLERECNSTYTINVSQLLNEDKDES